MKETEIIVKITVKENGATLEEITSDASVPVNTSDNEKNTVAGIYSDDDEELTEGEAERYAIASDLANVCEYLEDSEVIKIRLIVSKAEARKKRADSKK